MNEEQKKALDRVEKLLRHAGKTQNADEAASYTARAMKILEDYNLDIASVDESEDGSGRRSEEKLTGGFYQFERDIWAWVAELNFCLHWHQMQWVDRPANQLTHARVLAYQDPWRQRHILRGVHKLVGKTVNVTATKIMAQYLLQTTERLTRERLGELLRPGEKLNSQLRSRWAVSYREGIAETITDKLWHRKREQEQEELLAQKEARERAEAAGLAGATTETALTVASVRKTEREANLDFVYGEGFSADLAARRAEAARRAAEYEAEMTRLKAENPEEYRRLQEEAEAEERRRARRRSRSSGGSSKERDWSAYSAGREAGRSVSIDPQASSGRASGGIGHTRGALSHD